MEVLVEGRSDEREQRRIGRNRDPCALAAGGARFVPPFDGNGARERPRRVEEPHAEPPVAAADVKVPGGPAPAGRVRVPSGGARVEVPHPSPRFVSELEAGGEHAVFPLRLLVLQEKALVEPSDPVEDLPPRREDGARQVPDASSLPPEPETFACEGGETAPLEPRKATRRELKEIATEPRSEPGRKAQATGSVPGTERSRCAHGRPGRGFQEKPERAG